MGTNPEGSRDISQAREDALARPLSAVPSEGDAVSEGEELDELAADFDASLESSEPPETHAPTSADAPGERSDEFVVPMTSMGEPRSDDTRVDRPSQAGVPKRDSLFGQVLADRYRILDLIGKGGMGKVYLAEHVALGKRVAVKVLNPAYTNRPDQVKRFLREAQAASTIGHENVIDITDFGEMPNGQVFFAMEHLQGEDLGKILKKQGLIPWPRARRILLQICRALQAAHGKGIIHRDMKPENCFVIHRNGLRDFVKVLDFGIAKFLEENRDGGSNPLTQIGALIGTPEYMAPEQIHGESADLRMDIYAVGCIMYQLLTGSLPFTDKTMYGVLSQQVNVKPTPPRQAAPDADIPPEVEAIILKAMEKDKTLRYQTMAELLEGLLAAPRGQGNSPDRMGTTTNLDAAASAARLAAGVSGAQPGPFNNLEASNGALGAPNLSQILPTTSSASGWPRAMDEKMLTRLVIGLGAAVLVLVVGLVCALNRKDDDPRPAEGTAAAPEAAEPKIEAPRPEPKIEVVPPPPPETKAEPVKPPDEAIVVDDVGDAAKPIPTPEVKKDPVKKDPVKKVPKKTDGGVAGDPTNWPEQLGPVERKKVLDTYRGDFDGCRQAATPKGKTFRIKLKVDGPTGRVLDAVPEDGSVEGKCLAKVFRSKVRFPRSRKTPQDPTMIVSL